MLSFYSHLIDDDQYQIIQFFELFFNTKKNSYSIDQLQKSLGVSRYKIKYIISISNDFVERVPNLNVNIDQNIVTCEYIDQSTIRRITTISATQSIKFQIFLHIFLNPKKLTDKELQTELGISAATYFRLKKQLKNTAVYKKIKSFTPYESQLRYIIFRILEYFDFFTSPLLQENLPKKFLTQVNNSITYSAILLGNSPTYSQRQQTLHFAIVNYFRSRQNHYISKDNDDNVLVKINLTSKIALFNNHLSSNWHIHQGEYLLQTRLYATFLVSIQQIPVSKLTFLTQYQNIVSLTNNQTRLTSKLFNSELDVHQFTNFQKQLIKINATSISPFLKIDLLTQHSWFPKKINTNITINKLRDDLINIYIKNNDFSTDKLTLSYIYTQYTLNITNELFPHYYKRPIYIAVDFSQDLRENYVVNHLITWSNLNIYIEKNVSNKTDILISDTHNPNFHNEFIWKDDPDIIDWINLYEFIQLKHSENNKI
ncbi:hypothetical protein [Weissella bombi]|uniref:Mga helix-turn-helix domain-containing protein n=1 Tax=Weissella bombi TaxID=1505725 RepID=A0A1C3Z2N0_9LACO|nr:hypothetical protein [Weissella bombi]SCB76518.1 hypothetical protein GA0061074_101268 [Weissella bombi]